MLPIESKGALTPARAKRIRESIVLGLQRARIEVVEETLVDGFLEGVKCEGTTCAAAVALQLSADWVVHAHVTAADSVYDARIEAVGAAGESLATATERCEICGIEELGERVADRTAALAAKVETLDLGPPRVEIQSTPRGAEVWIDDEMVGRTPFEHELRPGEHVVRLEHRGYASQRRRMMAVEGTTEALRFELWPQPAEPPPRLLPWAIGSLSAGAVTLAAGATLIAIDERPYRSACAPDPAGRCAQRYDTLAGGVALTVSGGVLLATGVALLLVERAERVRGPHATRRVRFPRGGLAIAF